MAASSQALPGQAEAGVRREQREDMIRVVEYSPFPRTGPQHLLRVGFTRDLSRSGMCLGVDEAGEVGSLIRLCTRDIDGRPGEARVGRVVWISSARDERFWMGIEMLTPPVTAATAPCPQPIRRGDGSSGPFIH